MHYNKNTIVKHKLVFVCGEEEEASKHPRSAAHGDSFAHFLKLIALCEYEQTWQKS